MYIGKKGSGQEEKCLVGEENENRENLQIFIGLLQLWADELCCSVRPGLIEAPGCLLKINKEWLVRVDGGLYASDVSEEARCLFMINLQDKIKVDKDPSVKKDIGKY